LNNKVTKARKLDGLQKAFNDGERENYGQPLNIQPFS
jgi:hypothetical protein